MEFTETDRKALVARRREHRLTKLWEEIRKDITKRIENDERLSASVEATQEGVADGTLVPRLASHQILDAFTGLMAPKDSKSA